MYPLKFEPILKQTLWGGEKIIPFKQLNETLKKVGESWELSGVENNESIVANGVDKGLTLTGIVRKYRDELVGKANYARFGNKFLFTVISAETNAFSATFPVSSGYLLRKSTSIEWLSVP
ncbi:Mannose-6-phosphate isomerase ManA, partial [termite gut metagenome]